MKLLRGSSIIEVIVATALISVAIIAALSLVNSSQKQNTYAKDLAEATKFSTQAADWVRSQRDSLGWATISNKSNGPYCLNTLPIDFNTLPTEGDCTDYISNTFFKRQITLDTSQKGSGVVKITINTSWQDTTTRNANIELELTKW